MNRLHNSPREEIRQRCIFSRFSSELFLYNRSVVRDEAAQSLGSRSGKTSFVWSSLIQKCSVRAPVAPCARNETCSINRSDSNLAEQLRLSVRARTSTESKTGNTWNRVKNYCSPRGMEWILSWLSKGICAQTLLSTNIFQFWTFFLHLRVFPRKSAVNLLITIGRWKVDDGWVISYFWANITFYGRFNWRSLTFCQSCEISRNDKACC